MWTLTQQDPRMGLRTWLKHSWMSESASMTWCGHWTGRRKLQSPQVPLSFPLSCTSAWHMQDDQVRLLLRYARSCLDWSYMS